MGRFFVDVLLYLEDFLFLVLINLRFIEYSNEKVLKKQGNTIENNNVASSKTPQHNAYFICDDLYISVSSTTGIPQGKAY